MSTGTAPGSARRRALAAYVAVVVSSAIAATAAALTYSHVTVNDHWATSILVLVLVVMGQLLRIRASYDGHHHDLNFVEAALAVLFVGHTFADVAVITAAATAISMAAQRVTSFPKALFNIAQWVLAAVAGYGVYYSVTLAADSRTGMLAAVAAGTVTAAVVNQLLFTGAIVLASPGPGRPTTLGQDRSAFGGRALSVLLTVSCGVVLAGASMWDAWTVAFAFIPLLLLHWTSKGYAEARADRVRLSGLQHVTHELSVSFDVDEALPVFLAGTRAAFEVARAELWLFGDSGLERRHEAGQGEPVDTDIVRPWLEAAVQRADIPVIRTSQFDERLPEAWHRALVVPLRSPSTRYGALCLLDRMGMEGFEDGEVAVASAIGNELVGFLDRAGLVNSLLEERSKTSRIVEQTSDGITTIAADGTILTWNAALESLTGYTASEMVGTSHLGVLRTRDDSSADVWLDQWPTRPSLPERLQVRTSTGETRWLSCSFTRATHADAATNLIVVARDVTAAHELERLKDDFVAVVSHELRTPLVPIKGWAQMLLTRGDRLSPEQRRDALESIQAQAQRLERLVLNILEASRIEHGIEPIGTVVDVSEITARVVDEMLPSCATHVVRVRGTEEPVNAMGQPIWIERALANLVANAVKYSPADTTVDVVVEAADNEVLVHVVDEGPGIPVAWRERIFERFERVPETRTQTGTGLGLYITRQLVTAMGGRVDVDSSVGHGTTFTVRLRAATSVPPPRKSDVTSAGNPQISVSIE